VAIGTNIEKPPHASLQEFMITCTAIRTICTCAAAKCPATSKPYTATAFTSKL
jgi:hypothetical protein